MKELLIAFILLVLQVDTHAQMLNSWSADSTGLYYYSIDTLIKRIKVEKVIERVIVSKEVLNPHVDFPVTIAGVEVIEFSQSVKSKDLSQNDIYIQPSSIQLDRDLVYISFIVFHKLKKQLTTYRDGGYFFTFRFQPETKTYRIERIAEGLVTVHFNKKR